MHTQESGQGMKRLKNVKMRKILAFMVSLALMVSCMPSAYTISADEILGDETEELFSDDEDTSVWTAEEITPDVKNSEGRETEQQEEQPVENPDRQEEEKAAENLEKDPDEAEEESYQDSEEVEELAEEATDVEQEEPVTYTRTVDNVIVTATAASGVIPEDAEFVVTSVEKESDQ